MHKLLDPFLLPLFPPYTKPTGFLPIPFPLYKETPVIFLPLPKEAKAGKSRSKVPAPTVIIHGAVLANEALVGPLFPAEQETNIPFSIAEKAPTAIVSRKYGADPPPNERERTSTPSEIALSIPARISEPKQPVWKQTLYAAIRARVAIPRAVPLAYPSKLALDTCPPAAVLAVWVPCPSVSRGETTSSVLRIPPEAILYPCEKARAPMSFLLQTEGRNSGPDSHSPFHRVGTGGKPASLKELDSGQIPVSRTPIMTSLVSK
ncbi:unnamed protein product [Amaranthus hypochondriacus]